MALATRKKREGEMVMHGGGHVWITHGTCNNISCMHIMEMQVDLSTTQLDMHMMQTYDGKKEYDKNCKCKMTR